MSTLSFLCGILIRVKKIDLTPFRDVCKWTWVKVTLKLLTAPLWMAILSVDLNFTVTAVTSGGSDEGGRQ